MHYCACTSEITNKYVSFFGFTNEELDDIQVILTYDGATKLGMCDEARNFVRDNSPTVAELVEFACSKSKLADLLPAAFCFITSTVKKDENLFREMVKRESTGTLNKHDKLTITRFVKAMALSKGNYKGKTPQ